MAPTQFGEEWGEAAPFLVAAKELSEQAEKEATAANAENESAALLRLAQAQLTAARQAGNRKGQAGPLLAIAEGHLGAGAHGKAIEAASQVQELLAELGLAAGEAGALQLLAEVHLAAASQAATPASAEDCTTSALIAAQRACSIFRQLGHRRGEVGAAQTLAKVHLAERKPADALQAATQALEAAKLLGDKELQADSLGIVWKARFMDGSADQEAEDAAQQALELYQEMKDANGQAAMLHALACAQLGGKRPEEAMQSANKALALFRRLDDKIGEEAVKQKIRDIYQYKVQEQSNNSAEHGLGEAIHRHTSKLETEELKVALIKAVALLRQGSKKERALVLARGAAIGATEQSEGEGAASSSSSQALRIAAGALPLTWGIVGAEEAAAEATAGSLVSQLQPEELEGRAAELFRDAGDHAGEAAALCAAAEARFLLERDLSAEKANAVLATLEKARALYRDIGDKEGEVAVLDSMVVPSLQCGLQEVALQLADDALAMRKELEDRKGMAEISHLTVAINLCAGAEGRVLQRVQEARKLGREASGTPKVWSGRALHSALVAQLMRADYGAALRSAKELLQLFQEIDQAKGEATTWLMIAEIHLERGVPDQALRAAKEALSICRGQGDAEIEASVLTAVANAFLQVSRGPEALRAATRAAALLEATGDQVGRANASTQIAQAHLASGDHRSAMAKAAEAVTLHQGLGGGRGEALALQTLAESYLRAEDKKPAMQAARDARAIFKGLGDKTGEASTLNTIAGILTMAGDNEEALKNARESLKQFHEAGDKKGEEAAKETCANLRGKANRPTVDSPLQDKPLGLKRAIAICVGGASGPNIMKKEAMISAEVVVGQAEVKDLSGHVTVVTGASRGIGKGIAEELAAYGAVVYVTGRSAPGKVTDPVLQGTVDETVASFVKLGGLGVSVHIDHIQDTQNKALANMIATNHGRLDCVVNNAYYFPKPDQLFFNTPLWCQPNRLLNEQATVGQINHAALTLMLMPCLRRGKGLVVNVSSGSCQNQLLGHFPSSYLMNKAACERTMAAIGEQVAHRGVHVITLWPGAVKTERVISAARRTGYRMVDLEYCRFSGKAVAKILKQDEVALSQFCGRHRIVSSADVINREQDGYRNEGGLVSFTTGGRLPYKNVAPAIMQGVE